MICDNCIHKEICSTLTEYEESLRELETKHVDFDNCEHFTDMGKMIKLPCKVGDTVYRIVNLVNGISIVAKGIISDFQRDIYCDKDQLYFKDNHEYHSIWFDADKFSKTVFLTKEDAQAELERLEGKK